MVLWWIVQPGGINPWLDRVAELAPSITREMIVEWAEPQVQNNHKYMGESAHVCKCSLQLFLLASNERSPG